MTGVDRPDEVLVHISENPSNQGLADEPRNPFLHLSRKSPGGIIQLLRYTKSVWSIGLSRGGKTDA
jgi:hypothetical protein